MHGGAAFLYLTRVSQTSSVKLRDVAAELVRSANEVGATTDATSPMARPEPGRML
jgi:hypothetical protein